MVKTKTKTKVEIIEKGFYSDDIRIYYSWRKRQEGQDRNNEEVDVWDTFELDKKGQWSPRKHCVSLGTHFIPFFRWFSTFNFVAKGNSMIGYRRTLMLIIIFLLMQWASMGTRCTKTVILWMWSIRIRRIWITLFQHRPLRGGYLDYRMI